MHCRVNANINHRRKKTLSPAPDQHRHRWPVPRAMSPLTERTPRSPQREEEQCAASRVRSLLMTVCVQHCEQVLRLYVVLRFFCTGSVLCHQPVLFLLILFCWSWLGWSVCVRECFSSVFGRIKYTFVWRAVYILLFTPQNSREVNRAINCFANFSGW